MLFEYLILAIIGPKHKVLVPNMLVFVMTHMLL